MSDAQLYVIEASGPRPLPVPAQAASFDDLYDGLALGVYSALRTFAHNKFLYLAHHLMRTVNSMQVLGWTYMLDEARLRSALHEVCSAYPAPEARVRFDILAAAPTHLGTNSREIIGLVPFTPLPSQVYASGVKVGFAQALRRERPLAKTAAFAQQRKKVDTSGALHDYLLLDDKGYLLEGTNTNFYGVRGGVLWTAGRGVLEGITRQIILQLAAELQMPIKLEAIHQEEIPYLQEAAVSSSSRGLLPVVQIGEQVVGDGRPGPLCQRLLSAYNTFVSREIKTAIE